MLRWPRIRSSSQPPHARRRDRRARMACRSTSKPNRLGGIRMGGHHDRGRAARAGPRRAPAEKPATAAVRQAVVGENEIEMRLPAASRALLPQSAGATLFRPGQVRAASPSARGSRRHPRRAVSSVPRVPPCRHRDHVGLSLPACRTTPRSVHQPSAGFAGASLAILNEQSPCRASKGFGEVL